jgi:hypothetical protein
VILVKGEVFVSDVLVTQKCSQKKGKRSACPRQDPNGYERTGVFKVEVTVK